MQEQIEQIFNPLEKGAVIINQLKEEYKLECKIYIVMIIENGQTPSMYLEDELIQFASSIIIDLYDNPFEDNGIS
ncbi:MAG: DUF4279 domain-containing protein [Bacillus sp. (in: firmicutes)]